MSPQSTTVEHAVCTFCGCACDDIEIETDGSRVVRAGNACRLGEAGLSSISAPLAPALIDNQPASLDEAIAHATDRLSAARAPLVYGLDHSTCETQRRAVAIADLLGGYLDLPASLTRDAPGMFFPDVGEVTCSLGEVKNRADLIVYWGGDPATTHPRLPERYGHDAVGEFTPRGRTDRTVVVVGSAPTALAYAADVSIPLDPERTFEALWTLRALVQKRPIDVVPNVAWRALADRMRDCQFGVLFFSPTAAARDLEAANALATDLNAQTRFYVIPLRGAGNPVGAEQVVTWQAGFPLAVGFHRGAPRHFGGEFAAGRLLARGAVDAVLTVNANLAPILPLTQSADTVRPTIVAVAPGETATTRVAAVVLFTAPPAIAAVGTIYRTDEIALPLRPAIRSSFPSEDAVLRQIEDHLRARAAHGRRSEPARRPPAVSTDARR